MRNYKSLFDAYEMNLKDADDLEGEMADFLISFFKKCDKAGYRLRDVAVLLHKQVAVCCSTRLFKRCCDEVGMKNKGD